MKNKLFNNNRTQEEELEILNNRLISSTYCEDKIEALETIHIYSLQNPVSVGIICLINIYSTLKDVNKFELQSKLLRNILNNSFKNEFIEMIFKNDENISILFNLKSIEINECCKLFESKFFFKKIANFTNCNKIIMNLLKSDLPLYIVKIIENNNELATQLIFENVIEKILEKLENKFLIKDIKNKFENILIYLLKNFIIVQNYFIENEIYNFPLFNDDQFINLYIKIIVELLNIENNKYMKFQMMFFKQKLIYKAIKSKYYDFLKVLVFENEFLIKILSEKYLNFDILIEDAKINSDAYKLLWECKNFIGKVDLNIIDYSIALIHFINGNDYGFKKKAIIDIKSQNITKELLLFIIMSFDKIDELEKYILYENYSGLVQYLSIVLLLQHKIEIKLNKYEIIAKLKKLRIILCNELILNEYFTEMLILLINDIINEQINIKLENKYISMYEIPKNNLKFIKNNVNEKVDYSKSNKVIKEEEINTEITLKNSFTHFKKNGIKRISNVFNFLKKDENENLNNYSL